MLSSLPRHCGVRRSGRFWSRASSTLGTSMRKMYTLSGASSEQLPPHSGADCETVTMAHLPASAALERFRVIDLTQVRAGPTACRQLADWGADVIQVQMPDHMRGDDTLGGQDGSDYQYTHRNKRSVTLNLKELEGISALKRLIATADVVVENFRPDVKFRLGIDYEALSKEQPRLVYASISGLGQ